MWESRSDFQGRCETRRVWHAPSFPQPLRRLPQLLKEFGFGLLHTLGSFGIADRGSDALEVCHEHEHELVMLYRRWELASRSRLAGAGFKPPGAAALKRRGGERPWKRRPFRALGVC